MAYKSNSNKWDTNWDQIDLSTASTRLLHMAAADIGKTKNLPFKGSLILARLVKAGKPNGLGEEWRIGLTTKHMTNFPSMEDWNMFLWSLPVMGNWNKRDLWKPEEIVFEHYMTYAKTLNVVYRYKLNVSSTQILQVETM